MNKNDNVKKVAEALLKIKAVFLRPNDPFTWASGIKSPIYCDNRLTLSYPDVRKIIENGLADVVRAEYPECNGIYGTSTAGIAHAAIVADILGLPMGYVRASDKTHGRNNKIEGVVPTGKKVVVVEDLISTAGSAIDVCESLCGVGAEVLGIVSIFTYQMQKGFDRLNGAKLKNTSLATLDALLETAVESGYITERECRMVKTFRDNPSDGKWSETP